MDDPARKPDRERETLTGELLRRFVAGDFEAQRRLFQRQQPALLARAERDPRLRQVARHATPEDVVQEVFWRALSSGLFARFEQRGAGSFGRALGKILERATIDTLRRHGALKRGEGAEPDSLDELDDDEVEAALATDDTTPTERLYGDELIELCRAKLGPEEWMVWSAVEVQGASRASLAARLALDVRAVDELLFRARKRLIAYLATLPGYRPPR